MVRRCAKYILYMCPHTTIYHTTTRVSSFSIGGAQDISYMCPLTTIHVFSYYYICVLILRDICYICVLTICVLILILLYVCPHSTICVLILLYVSSYYYVCVLILLYVSSNTGSVQKRPVTKLKHVIA